MTQPRAPQVQSRVRRLLFVTYGGGHVHMVYPVVQALQKTQAWTQGLLHIDVLGLPAATATLQAQGIAPLGFGDFLDAGRDADALKWGRDLAASHHSPTLGIDQASSVAYLGLNYRDLVLQHGEPGAAELFARRGRQAFFPLHTMRGILDACQPDAVITTNSPRSEAAAIAVANERGIASFIMADLFTGLGDYVLQARDICFLNEFARDMFVADGLADPAVSRLHCTGNPAFDRITARRHALSPGWLAAHVPGLPEVPGPVVLHADMPAWWDNARQCSHFKDEAEIRAELEACYAAVTANGAHYLVRPHPSQDRAFYRRWVESKPDAWLAAECDLHDLLSQVDLVLARTTTVALEAALMRRRVLQIEAAQHRDLPLAAMGVAWGSQSYASLASDVKSALADDLRFGEVCRQMDRILPLHPAAPKIADIILKQLKLADGPA